MIRFRCFAFDSLRPPPPPPPIFFIPPRLPARVRVQPRIVCSLFIYRFNEYIREKALQNTRRTGRYERGPCPPSPTLRARIFSTNFLPARISRVAPRSRVSRFFPDLMLPSQSRAELARSKFAAVRLFKIEGLSNGTIYS